MAETDARKDFTETAGDILDVLDPVMDNIDLSTSVQLPRHRLAN